MREWAHPCIRSFQRKVRDIWWPYNSSFQIYIGVIGEMSELLNIHLVRWELSGRFLFPYMTHYYLNTKYYKIYINLIRICRNKRLEWQGVEQEGLEMRKLRTQLGPYICWWLMLTKFIKHQGFLYTIYRGKMVKVSRQQNQQMLVRSAQDTSDTAVWGRGKSWSHRNGNLDSLEALAPAPDWTLPSLLLD